MLAISAVVEEMIDKAARALNESSIGLSEEVIALDVQVDQHEVRIEEECLKILALHQPVARDLRRLATVLKVNNDLERIADLAVSIAERALDIADTVAFPLPSKLPRMANMAAQMVHGVLDAFVNLDSTSARRIILLDDDVDQYNRDIIEELRELMTRRTDLISPALHCFSATRHFERIADHATNIAEDVIYLVEGEIVRHGNQQFLKEER